MDYAKLFEPVKIGKIELKNRIVMAPMGLTGLSTTEGVFNQRAINFFVERAKGGTGLIITGLARVENEIEEFAMPSSPCPLLNPAAFYQTAIELTERVHAYDTRIFLQLTMGFGRVAHPSVLKTHPIAPSAIPNYWEPNITCRELSIEEIETIIHKFGQVAILARESGFDGIEVHAVHEGYLLDQFAISMFNRRKDKYGGSLENRLRAALEIVKEIKKSAGRDFPVILRYSLKSYIKDWNKGGLPKEKFKEMGRDIPEGIEAAILLEKGGYDAFDVDAGSYDSWYWAHPPMYFEDGNYLPFSSELKKHTNVPIIVAGKLQNPKIAEKAIKEGKTDMIALARGLLADPHWAIKVKRKKIDEIRPCLGCHVCLGRIARGKNLSCAVNPQTGRESDYNILLPTNPKKKIVIIGGGIAGMEAARVAAMKGYNVTLFEKSNRLGGHIIAASVPDFKKEDRTLLRWYENRLKEQKVDIRLNEEADISTIEEESPDSIIVATGSVPFIPPINGINTASEIVSTATDVLLGKPIPGTRVTVIGGGLVGCELSIWLKKQGKEVAILEMLNDILLLGEVEHPNRLMLKEMIESYGIQVITGITVTQIVKGSVVFKKGSKEQKIETDFVVLATGFRSQNHLYKELLKTPYEAFAVGDTLKPSNIKHAIWTAYEVARKL